MTNPDLTNIPSVGASPHDIRGIAKGALAMLVPSGDLPDQRQGVIRAFLNEILRELDFVIEAMDDSSEQRLALEALRARVRFMETWGPVLFNIRESAEVKP